MKQNSASHLLQHRRHRANGNKPVTRGQMLHDFTYMVVHRVVNFTETASGEVGGQGLEGRESGRLVFDEHRVSSGMVEKFWRWMVVMGVKQCECSYSRRTVRLKR